MKKNNIPTLLTKCLDFCYQVPNDLSVKFCLHTLYYNNSGANIPNKYLSLGNGSLTETFISLINPYLI